MGTDTLVSQGGIDPLVAAIAVVGLAMIVVGFVVTIVVIHYKPPGHGPGETEVKVGKGFRFSSRTSPPAPGPKGRRSPSPKA